MRRLSSSPLPAANGRLGKGLLGAAKETRISEFDIRAANTEANSRILRDFRVFCYS
jgi:hypothetical protein